MALEVKVYSLEGHVEEFSLDKGNEVDFVSLVSPETYGPPALVAPNNKGQGQRAAVEDRVLYINTALVPFFEIERISD